MSLHSAKAKIFKQKHEPGRSDLWVCRWKQSWTEVNGAHRTNSSLRTSELLVDVQPDVMKGP